MRQKKQNLNANDDRESSPTYLKRLGIFVFLSF
jgi:hypothetical protein